MVYMYHSFLIHSSADGHLVFLPVESHGQRSLAGCSPCVCAKSLQLCPTLCDPMDLNCIMKHLSSQQEDSLVVARRLSS